MPAPRGAIFDRNGKLLVDSRSTFNVILSREDLKGKDYNALVQSLVDVPLSIDSSIVEALEAGLAVYLKLATT